MIAGTPHLTRPNGLDAVMRSAESASGRYPIEAVRVVAQTVPLSATVTCTSSGTSALRVGLQSAAQAAIRVIGLLC